MTPNFWSPACTHPSAVAAIALRPSGACQTYQSPPQPPGPRRGGRLSALSAQPLSTGGCGRVCLGFWVLDLRFWGRKESGSGSAAHNAVGLAGESPVVSGDSNSDPLLTVLIPTPVMPSCYRLLTPSSGSFLIFTSVSRWVCSGSTFVNLDRINPLLRFSRSR